MGLHCSPRGRSRDRSRFGPGEIPGPNPNPSLGSLLMGTQFQGLTASHACGPEAVQADSARNLGGHHVVSQARLQRPRGLLLPPQPGAYRSVWPWQQNRDPDRHRPLCPQLSPRGDPCPVVGSAPENSWDLTLTLSLPRTGTLHQNLSLPRSLILNLSRLLAWALISALGGHHETGVASDEATSQDRTLTLAKSLSSGDPTPTSDSITCLGSRSGAG